MLTLTPHSRQPGNNQRSSDIYSELSLREFPSEFEWTNRNPKQIRQICKNPYYHDSNFDDEDESESYYDEDSHFDWQEGVS
jgi:hypothetical protein